MSEPQIAIPEDAQSKLKKTIVRTTSAVDHYKRETEEARRQIENMVSTPAGLAAVRTMSLDTLKGFVEDTLANIPDIRDRASVVQALEVAGYVWERPVIQKDIDAVLGRAIEARVNPQGSASGPSFVEHVAANGGELPTTDLADWMRVVDPQNVLALKEDQDTFGRRVMGLAKVLNMVKYAGKHLAVPQAAASTGQVGQPSPAAKTAETKVPTSPPSSPAKQPPVVASTPGTAPGSGLPSPPPGGLPRPPTLPSPTAAPPAKGLPPPPGGLPRPPTLPSPTAAPPAKGLPPPPGGLPRPPTLPSPTAAPPGSGLPPPPGGLPPTRTDAKAGSAGEKAVPSGIPPEVAAQIAQRKAMMAAVQSKGGNLKKGGQKKKRASGAAGAAGVAVQGGATEGQCGTTFEALLLSWFPSPEGQELVGKVTKTASGRLSYDPARGRFSAQEVGMLRRAFAQACKLPRPQEGIISSLEEIPPLPIDEIQQLLKEIVPPTYQWKALARGLRRRSTVEETVANPALQALATAYFVRTHLGVARDPQAAALAPVLASDRSLPSAAIVDADHPFAHILPFVREAAAASDVHGMLARVMVWLSMQGTQADDAIAFQPGALGSIAPPPEHRQWAREWSGSYGYAWFPPLVPAEEKTPEEAGGGPAKAEAAAGKQGAAGKNDAGPAKTAKTAGKADGKKATRQGTRDASSKTGPSHKPSKVGKLGNTNKKFGGLANLQDPNFCQILSIARGIQFPDEKEKIKEMVLFRIREGFVRCKVTEADFKTGNSELLAKKFIPPAEEEKWKKRYDEVAKDPSVPPQELEAIQRNNPTMKVKGFFDRLWALGFTWKELMGQ